MLGKMRMLLDDAVPAEQALTSAIGKGYQDNSVYYWRGRARFAQHDYAGAEKDFAESIQRGRDDEDTKHRREQAAALLGSVSV